MQIYTFFPKVAVKFQLDRNYKDEEISFVNLQETHKNMGNKKSNNCYVLHHDAMSDLKSFIEKSLNEYLKIVYSPKNEISLRITQSWLNYCEPGEWHHKHRHSNSFISGVLYIKAKKSKDKIYFYNDVNQNIVIPTNDWNLYNSNSWWFEVESGDLMIFSSSLIHSVEPVEEDRISLSFNTFLEGYLGEEESLNALYLKLGY